MINFDQNPLKFRLLFLILLSGLLIFAFVNFYRYTSSPTDENWFVTAPSRIYVTKNIPVEPGSPSGYPESSTASKDSIRIGDLLLSIDGMRFKEVDAFYRLLENKNNNDRLNIRVHRPTQKPSLNFVVQKKALPDSFIRQVPTCVWVYDVFDGGASDRAGMIRGELVYSINGQTFGSSAEADRILRRGESGKTIEYEVIRDNKSMTLYVKLANFGIQFPLLVMVFSGLVYLIVGGFIGLRQPRLKAARLLGLGLSLLGVYITVAILQRDVRYDAFAHVRYYLIVITLFFGWAFWLHSNFYFPKERSEINRKERLALVYYVIGIFFGAFAIISRNERFVYLGLGVLIIYYIVLNLIYRKKLSAEYKKLNRSVKWTGIAVVSLIVLTIFYSVFMSQKTRPINIGYIGIPLVLIPLSYLYTIGRYRLLEMNLRIRRNKVYILVKAMWIALLILIGVQILIILPGIDFKLPNIRFSGTLIEITESPLQPAQRELLERVVLMILSIAVTITFWKIGRYGQRLIDKKFYRTHYDYKNAAVELAEVMASNLNITGLARGLTDKLGQLMQLQGAGVLFFRQGKILCCQETTGMNRTNWQKIYEFVEKNKNRVLIEFKDHDAVNVNYLGKEFKSEFQNLGVRHVIPIQSKDKLIGLLLLGEKLSESPYDREDLEFLISVAKQASIAIENAFLYDELAGQERIKHELELARNIQLSSLPQITPKVEGLDIAGISLPATEVGGDYFDYLNSTVDAFTVIVGDVSGKGISAALYMSKVQGILQSLQGFGLTLRERFIRVNDILRQNIERNSFVTAIGADFNTKNCVMVFTRAGHLPLFCYRTREDRVSIMTPKGIGLGLENGTVFAEELEEQTIPYVVDDVFVFITDGVTEAKNTKGDEFGENAICSVLSAYKHQRASHIRDQIVAAVERHTGGSKQFDDQTVVVVKAV